MAARKRKARKAPARSDLERLQTLVNASVTVKVTGRDGKTVPQSAPLYTQRELAKMLGVSASTLRRVKNEPGYKPSEKTLKKIAKPLRKEESRVRQHVRKKYTVPDAPVLNLPLETILKSGDRSLYFDVDGWSRDAKVNLLVSFSRSRQWYSWHLIVRLNKGYAHRSPENPGDFTTVVKVRGQKKNQRDFYTTRPQAFPQRREFFESEVRDAEQHGVVTQIYVFQFGRQLKQSRRKKRKGKK
jgi:transcriptional regulator with XRE-family HTH domain